MRVLVTGSEGYLGVIVSDVLSAAGHEVVGFDSGLFVGCDLGPMPERPSVTHRVDLRDVSAEHLAGIDAVAHLAALSNDPLGNLAPEITYDINQHASMRLATLARDVGVKRFLYSSTCSVYGAAEGDLLLDEDAPLAPVTPYAVSKVRVEEGLDALQTQAFTPVYLRNATAYGYSPRQRLDIVLNNLVASALLTGTVRVLSDGTPWRPLAHARDIAAAFLALLEAPAEVVSGRAYNIGRDADNYRVSEIAETVADVVPDCVVDITGEQGADPRSYRVDFSRIAREVPTFTPQWTLRSGTQELAERFTAFGLERGGLDLTYIRLKWLDQLLDSGKLTADLRFRD